MKQLPLPFTSRYSMAMLESRGMDPKGIADVLSTYLADSRYIQRKGRFHGSSSPGLAMWDDWFHPIEPERVLTAIRVIARGTLDEPVTVAGDSTTLRALLTEIKGHPEYSINGIREAAERKLAK